MNTIEKIIFDALAAGRGINLPGVGSLYVERQPAEFVSKKVLRPPHNKILFSTVPRAGCESVATYGDYGAWLEHAAQSKEVLEINGVGVLRSGLFYPSVELHDILNPVGMNFAPIKKKAGFGKKFLVGVGVIVIAAVVILLVSVVDKYVVKKSLSDYESKSEERLYRDEIAGADARGESTIAPVVASDVEVELSDAGTEAAESGQVEDVIEQQLSDYAVNATPAQSAYYLVAGVFSDPINADKLIATDPLKIGKGNYTKLPFKGGKTLVSAYSSTDREAVERRRRELSGINSDLWVYGDKE